MTPMEYFARNYVRNENPEHNELDEWWIDNPFITQAFVAGARKMVEELRAQGIPGISAGDELLTEHITARDLHLIAESHEPGEMFASDMKFRIGFGAEETLAPMPYQKKYRDLMTGVSHDSEQPAIHTLAFRMIQEVHAVSPGLVYQLTPLLAKHILENYDVSQGFEMSVEEIVSFCDRMISEGQVTMDSARVPFDMSEAEKAAMELIEEIGPPPEEDEEKEDDGPLPPFPPLGPEIF